MERGFKSEAEAARQHFEREMTRERSLEKIMREPGAGQCAIVGRQPALERRPQPNQVAFLVRGVLELRQQIRGAEVVEHEVVHPAATILSGEDTFSFIYFEDADDWATFAPQAA